MQPGADGGLAAEPAQRAEGAQGRLLQSVVDQVGVAQHAEGQQSQATLVRHEQIDEGVAIPPFRRLELGVGLCDLHHQTSLPQPAAARRALPGLRVCLQRRHAILSWP